MHVGPGLYVRLDLTNDVDSRTWVAAVGSSDLTTTTKTLFEEKTKFPHVRT